MTIKDYLGILRQRLLVVMITVFLTTGAAVLLQFRTTPTYQAKSKVLVIPFTPTGAGEELTTKFQFSKGAATEAEIVKSHAVAARVIKRLGLDKSPHDYTVEKLVDDVQIIPVQFTEVLEVIVEAADPQLASDLANAFPEEYIASRRVAAIQAAKDASESIAIEITLLLKKLNEVDALLVGTDPESSRGDLLESQRRELVARMSSLELTRQKLIDESPLKNRGVGEVIQLATPPKSRSNSDVARTAVLGLIIGMPLAMGLALLLEALNDTIKTKEEAERIVGAEMLGLIPLTPEWRSNKPYVVTKEAPYSAAAEAFRTLRINLDTLMPAGQGKHLLFTSPGSAEGKTITTANLGVAYAEAGRSALLIGADLRRPRLHRLFGVEASPGLSELLNEELEDHDVIVEPSPNLYLLPSGGMVDRPDKLLGNPEVHNILANVSVARAPGKRPKPRNDENGTRIAKDAPQTKTKIYTQPDVVLFDAPAVLGAAEVSSLARAVDGVVLILHSGMTRREAAARAAEQIRRAGGKILGVVLVGARVDNDYSVYPPMEEESMTENEDSTWSKVVGSLRK